MKPRFTSSAHLAPTSRAFVLVLVWAICQFSLLLHETDIAHHADGEPCSICLATGSVNGAPGADHTPSANPPTQEAPGLSTAGLPAARTPARLVARSPPVPTLHA